MATRPRVLVILTSHAELGNTGRKTGFWLEELAVPYNTFVRAGALVDLASPRGGRPPIDPSSAGSDAAGVASFRADREAMGKLEVTLPLSVVEAEYDAYFVAGGHGVMWDLPQDPHLQSLLSAATEGGRVVAAVCHGPAALVGVRLASGRPLVEGRRVSAFSDEEETAVGLTGVVPFLLQARLEQLGGKYARGPIWQPFAVTDGRLVTGQNPASSLAVAQQVLALLEVSAPQLSP